MDKDTSTSISLSNSGIQSPTKRRKLEEKNTKQGIIDTMFYEVAIFGAPILRIIT